MEIAEEKVVTAESLLDRKKTLFRRLLGWFKYEQLVAEPVVDYLDGDNEFVINNYGALVWQSRNIFIADIDFGDCRLNANAGARDISEVVANVKDLYLLDNKVKAEYDAKLTEWKQEMVWQARQATWAAQWKAQQEQEAKEPNPDVVVSDEPKDILADDDFAQMVEQIRAGKQVVAVEESAAEALAIADSDTLHWNRYQDQQWRIYRTYAGARVICASMGIRAEWEKDPILPNGTVGKWTPGYIYPDPAEVLQFLRSDGKYVEFCKKNKNYRARLTPKWRRDQKPETQVCELVEVVGPTDSPEITYFEHAIKLHDELTLRLYPEE